MEGLWEINNLFLIKSEEENNIKRKGAESEADTQQHLHKRKRRGYSQQSFERAVVVGQTPMGAPFLLLEVLPHK